jgi:hypothetical protein
MLKLFTHFAAMLCLAGITLALWYVLPPLAIIPMLILIGICIGDSDLLQ